MLESLQDLMPGRKTLVAALLVALYGALGQLGVVDWEATLPPIVQANMPYLVAAIFAGLRYLTTGPVSGEPEPDPDGLLF